MNADTLLGARLHRVGGVETDDVLDLLLDPCRFGAGEVDLVQNGEDLEILIDGHIDIGQGLRLHALGGVDDQQGAFASRQGAADLVGEIDVTRGVDQVESILLAVFSLVFQADRLRLDGNAALALQFHLVEELVFPFPVRQCSGLVEQAVGKCRFAVIDMGDNGEIANSVLTHMLVNYVPGIGD